MIDIVVEDEAEAVAVAKKYLSYFQGPVADWDAPDQRLLRTSSRRTACACTTCATVIETLADYGLGVWNCARTSVSAW